MKTLVTTLAVVVFLSWSAAAQAGHHEGGTGHTGHENHAGDNTTCEHSTDGPCPHAAKGEECPHHQGNECSHTANTPCTAEKADSKADA